MTETQEQLLSLLSQALFNSPSSNILTDEILTEARAQTVSTLIAPKYGILAANIRVINAHAKLTKLLGEIPFTTFKGYASAFYYPEPTMRPMGDVDFIVGSESYQDVVKLLESSGWKKSELSHDRHEAFHKGGVEFELHSEIKGIPNGIDGIITKSTTAEKKVRSLLANLIPTARIVETQQGKILIPDDFHHGLIMLLHVAGHMINDGGVGLRHLCDWAVYAEHVNLEQYKGELESVPSRFMRKIVCRLRLSEISRQ